MKQTGVAILGAGRWGKHLVRNFLAHPDACLVAVVDPYPETLAAIKDKYNLAPEVRLATDWESIRDLPTIEAVVIATPAVTHYTLIKDALQQGKHVLAEKPLTLDVAECLELCHLAQEKQLQLMVDHTYLFHPAVKRAQEVVNSGCLGDLRYGYAARTNLGPVRQDVDSLWDLAIHDIAIFNHCLGQPPVQVQATGRVWLQFQKEFQVSNLPVESSEDNQGCSQSLTPQQPDNLQPPNLQPPNLQPPNLQPANLQPANLQPANLQPNNLKPSTPQGLADLVQVTLTYPTGFQAFIHLCWLNPDKQRRLGIVGTQGTLIFDEMVAQAPLTIQHGYFEQNGEYFIPAGQHREVLDLESFEPLYSVCDRFLNSVRLSQPSSISSGWVGAQLVHILSCLSQSLHQGGVPVTVPQLPE
ncbi:MULTISPECIES: Gfo/Idh/MocA family oxidoreductase [unclassified Moorena]|uniref:Gfo/Idh/MocA family protein n=1 Tax=unclassified Moorena TaxID=2683338 RepID=UPI0013C9EDF8|nr:MULTISPECIES: Gfo/Idh/MocA family oxidoreductase [unclassified Moorena]NEO19076.1 Gfo/Idh/MocA family oxidoreductase [Moorena sp. SIO4A5]NEQ56418.1 Gfo/Idh/MocA family oxidoreductase [Moorena sp. SIO4A1]